MSQYDPKAFVDTESGSEVIQRLNAAFAAVVSGHKGATAPAYAEAGLAWIDDSGATWLLKRYDGADWIVEGEIDPVANTFTPVGGGGGGGSPGGADGQVQFNDGGSFGGEAGYEYDKTAGTLTVPNIAVTGDAAVSGTVDGRDVSADGAKLDGIEAGAQINAVANVFGRTGAVTAAASDYDASQVDNDSGVAGATVKDALDTLDAAVAGKAARDKTVATRTADHTLVLADADAVVEMDVAAANTLTVPPNSSVAFPVGTAVTVVQLGAGQTTVVAGSGVTVRTAETCKLRKQYAAAVLYKRGTDEWVLSGDLEAA